MGWRGEWKSLWWKDSTQPPLSHFSLPPSFPCPVELIWQRGGSISQFTQAACGSSFFFYSFFFSFAPCLLHCWPCLVSPPPSQSLPLPCLPFLCAKIVCLCWEWFILQAQGGGIIIWSNKRWRRPNPPGAANTCLAQGEQMRCHGTGIITCVFRAFLMCSLPHYSFRFSLLISTPTFIYLLFATLYSVEETN